MTKTWLICSHVVSIFVGIVSHLSAGFSRQRRRWKLRWGVARRVLGAYRCLLMVWPVSQRQNTVWNHVAKLRHQRTSTVRFLRYSDHGPLAQRTSNDTRRAEMHPDQSESTAEWRVSFFHFTHEHIGVLATGLQEKFTPPERSGPWNAKYFCISLL